MLEDDPTAFTGADGEAALAKMITEKGMSFLRNAINMDESAVSMHTPETETQSQQ